MAIVLTYDQSSLKQFETRTQIDYFLYYPYII